MAPEETWDDVFGDLDVRVLDRGQRLDWLNARIQRTIGEKDWAVLAAGDEGRLAWEAAVQTFLDGIWVACIFSCHVVCEREVAGVLSLSRVRLDDKLPKTWETFGLGRLLVEVQKYNLLPPDLIVEVQRVADTRKPYGHWRPVVHEDSLMQRVYAEQEETGNDDYQNLVQRLLVRDATQVLETTVRLYFGSYGLGGP